MRKNGRPLFKGMKQALTKIVKLIESWADDQKQGHEDVLLKILNTALKALNKKEKQK